MAHKAPLRFNLDPTAQHRSQASVEGFGGRALARLRINIAVAFENTDEHRLYVTALTPCLCERRGFGRVQEIPVREAGSSVVESTGEAPWTDRRGAVPVEGRFITEPLYYVWVLELPDGLGATLGKNHFLRVVMEAMRQPAVAVDCEVDWEAARQNGTYSSLKPIS